MFRKLSMFKDSGIVLLAAGKGLRFGGNKLLEEVGGKPLCYYAMNSIKQSGLPALVVYEDEGVAKVAHELGLRTIPTPRHSPGQGASIRVGALKYWYRRSIMIMVADQPMINPKTLIDLNERFKNSSKDKILTCHISGRRCPPILFGSKFYKELFTLNGDIGGRDILFRYPDCIDLYELSDELEALDIDTKDQLKEWTDQMVFPDTQNN